jgi:hedgehog protein
MTTSGPLPIEDVRIGDEILSVNSEGNPVFSPVILFLDRDVNSTRMYFKITTSSGKTITMTGSHLIYVIDEYDPKDFQGSFSRRRVQFARQVIPKQFVVTEEVDPTTDEHIVTSIEEVISVDVDERKGAFAPLTKEGNLVVNNVLVSCYANINDQSLAHVSFLPVRVYSNVIDSFSQLLSSPDHKRRDGRRKESPIESNGIHWYPRLLQSIANQVLPSNLMD